jgi:hypothetical protein
VARNPGSSDRAKVTLAEPLRRGADRVDSPRVSGSRDCAKRIRSVANSQILVRVLRAFPDSPLVGQRRSGWTADSAGGRGSDCCDSSSRRLAPSLRTNCRLNLPVRSESCIQSRVCVHGRCPAVTLARIAVVSAHQSELRRQEIRPNGVFGMDRHPQSLRPERGPLANSFWRVCSNHDSIRQVPLHFRRTA